MEKKYFDIDWKEVAKNESYRSRSRHTIYISKKGWDNLKEISNRLGLSISRFLETYAENLDMDK